MAVFWLAGWAKCPPKKKSKSDNAVYTSASDYMEKNCITELFHLKEG